MADNFQLITFDLATNPYTDDRGQDRAIKQRLYVPPGITAATIATIITETGARARLATDRVVCPDSGFKPRKLVFYSSAGGSIAVPIAERDSLIVAATAIRGALIADGFIVVCIKLVGESFLNIVDDLRPVAFAGLLASTTSSRPAAGGIQPNFFGKAQYRTDAIFSNQVVLPYKLQSDVALVFPSIFGAPILTLTGIVPVANINACPGSDPRTTRRYVVQSLVTENAVIRSQVTEIPVFLHLAAEILAAGEGIAALRHVQCLGYKGELNDRFHRLLP